MKLRKALEKAREMRESSGQDVTTMEKQGSEVSVENASVEKMSVAQETAVDWTAPSYNKSSPLRLDENLLRKNRCFCYFPDSPEADYYKVLRTQIRHRTKDKGWRTMMITSPTANEGKTLTSVNLAFTFAKEFHQTVLLVDADLKRQDVHKRLGYDSAAGLVDYLLDDKPLSDIVVWPGVEQLTVISGGNTLQDSTELLASPKMQSLADEMKNRYSDRYIVFDAPPLLGTADAISFAPLVDCVLMVVEAGNTSMQNVQDALKYIPEEKFLGFVLNRHGVVGEHSY